MLGIIAMVSMLIDHVGIVFFPDDVAYHWIGRLAFPIYIYFVVIGYQRTRNQLRYVLRLFILAVISQIPYVLLFDNSMINIIFTLLFCVIVLMLLDRNYHFSFNIILVMVSLLLLLLIPFEYSIYCLILMFVFRYIKYKLLILISHVILNLMVHKYFNWDYQHFSLIATACFLVWEPIQSKFRSWPTFNVPRWLWRSFYPLHLTILVLINYTF